MVLILGHLDVKLMLNFNNQTLEKRLMNRMLASAMILIIY